MSYAPVPGCRRPCRGSAGKLPYREWPLAGPLFNFSNERFSSRFIIAANGLIVGLRQERPPWPRANNAAIERPRSPRRKSRKPSRPHLLKREASVRAADPQRNSGRRSNRVTRCTAGAPFTPPVVSRVAVRRSPSGLPLRGRGHWSCVLTGPERAGAAPEPLITGPERPPSGDPAPSYG